MRARRHDGTDLDELVLPMWQDDKMYCQKKGDVEQYARELAELAYARDDAYKQVVYTETVFQDVEMPGYANAATAAEVATARQAHENAVVRQKTLMGKHTVCERTLERLRQELVTAEADAQQRCAVQLQTDHLRNLEIRDL
jgi:hypothetical protein